MASLLQDLPHDARILEVGCGVGHNLAYLHDLGYHHLEGIEISKPVVDVLRETYPQLADATSMSVGRGCSPDHRG